MIVHDVNATRADELLSLEDIAVDLEDSLADQFRSQRASSQRLNEYYMQVVAELRASLEKIEAEEG
jgi:hypothetical protein